MALKEQLFRMIDNHIFVYASEPGGVDALIPVIDILKCKFNVCVFGTDKLANRYENYGLECNDLEEILADISVDSLTYLFRKIKPVCVLTGTGATNMYERMMWEAARRCCIQSFALVDNSVNYSIRFSDKTLADISALEKHLPNTLTLPDYIFAIDDFCRNEMVGEGLPADRILTFGQPFYYRVVQGVRSLDYEDVMEYRAKQGCTNGKKLILYAPDQILNNGESTNNISYIGYNEYTVLKCITLAIDEIDPTHNSLFLMARPHPSDSNYFWNEVECNGEVGVPRCLTSSIELAIASADVVIGMYSSFLVMAFLAGKKVISAQIGLNREQPSVLCRKGLIKCASSMDELIVQLEAVLYGAVYKNNICENKIDNPAKEISKFIEKRIGKN